MDRLEELKIDYQVLLRKTQRFLEEDRELEYYVEAAMLRIWSANGRYAGEYADAIRAISGREYTPAQITRAMADSAEQTAAGQIPSFFPRMVTEDFNQGSRTAQDFVGRLRVFLTGAAYINGDFTIEESNMLSGEIKKLMTYAISKGVKIDYATGRIREKTTPLQEDSYVDPKAQSELNIGLIFDALDQNFLMPNRPERKQQVAGEQTGDGAGPQAGTHSPLDPPPKTETRTDQPAADAQQMVEVQEDPRTMEELLEELEGLVGLEQIKEDVRSLMNFIKIARLREERGMSVPTISYHLVFTGNPGTGKTTVARLVAGLYHRIGILPKGQLVEADRSQLVAGYTGQTAIKTMEVIQQALGGVLFIDEAYALVNDERDSFGKEAIETILKAMEDHRDELVVIVAGYTELMHTFIESNPGFRSRFSKFFEFQDYNGEELLAIFKRFCDKSGYRLNAEAESLLLIAFQDMYEHRDSHFGNGRTARNVFEKATTQQANRLAQLTGQVTDEMLQELAAEDLQAALDAENRKSQGIEVHG